MRLLLILVATAVLSLVLAVAYPDVMIEPGTLSEGHHSLERDCVRCHDPLHGASAARCLDCHKLNAIGRTTTAGVPLQATGARKIQFHASLANTDCTACHTLHASERHRREVVFQHALLAAATRNECQSCHLEQKPADDLHRRVEGGCGSCHATEAWKPATFDHRRMASGTDCATCHQKDRPADELHRQMQGSCAPCHSTTAWRPATFDHARYFQFDQNHPPDCRTCHVDSSTFSVYSCYGCHAHSPARIAAEHREEGIQNFDNCVRCHRSGQEGEAEGHGGGERGGSEGREHGEGGEHEEGDD